ncbi:diacylglycerol kinase [Amylibacter kogurei]|uniref:Diacylglycerol kinase n=1 Tax=Paramylibacter kogurei TaxID=1889778 RepID=A0A2G5K1N5_9RHOB|nr:cytochrome c [Amylibacter kogurei]PIB23438.1 diacylglycerol kinase [Amylibacter kogurei]
MKKLFRILFGLALIGAITAWFLSAPQYVDTADFENLSGDVARGEMVFAAGGCNSCHAAPDAKGDDKNILSGGQHFASDFGTFIAPNISPDPNAGIGDWELIDLANAMQRGVSPDGKHYYPAFPFTSYVRMEPQDIADLYEFLKTLPVSATPSAAHDVGFPFNIRRGLGLWKFLFFKSDAVMEPSDNAEIARGQYLVEGAGHCAECHTPRNLIGGLQLSKWLSGAPNPDGPGFIPNITQHDDALGTWSAGEIAEYLATGFTPEFDVVGGSMGSVVENMAKLPDTDRAAIAAYLKSMPALERSQPRQ